MRYLIYLFLLLSLASLVNAQVLENYNINFNIINKETNVEIELNSLEKINFNFYLDFPKDVNEIKLIYDDNEEILETKKVELNNFINIKKFASNIKIQYNTKGFIEKTSKNYFTTEVIPVMQTKKLNIKVILPETAVLDKPITDKVSSSVYPNPSNIETDGKRIIINFNYDNVNKFSEFPIFIVYKFTSNNLIYILLGMIILILIILFLFKFKKKEKIKVKKIKQDIDKYLIGDEKLIINALKKKGGKCTQATLVTITGVSKASLSRLLNQLEARNIITKEQLGNKNLIILKKR